MCRTFTRTPAGKRLASLLATVIPLLRRDGDITMTDVEAAPLVSMSAATIDRHLAPEQAKLSPRGRSRTKPGTLRSPLEPTWPNPGILVPQTRGRTVLHGCGVRTRVGRTRIPLPTRMSHCVLNWTQGLPCTVPPMVRWSGKDRPMHAILGDNGDTGATNRHQSAREWRHGEELL